MKKLFIRVFSENISENEFKNFYAAFSLLVRGRHLKINQVEIEINGEITQKLAEISDENKKYTGPFSTKKCDMKIIDKSFQALKSRVRNITKNTEIELWIITDWKNIDEEKFESSLDALSSIKQVIETFYFYETENDEISSMVTNSYQFSSKGVYERLSQRQRVQILIIFLA